MRAVARAAALVALVLASGVRAQTPIEFYDAPDDVSQPDGLYVAPLGLLDLTGGRFGASSGSLIARITVQDNAMAPSDVCHACIRLIAWQVGEDVYGLQATRTSLPQNFEEINARERYALVRISTPAPPFEAMAPATGFEGAPDDDSIFFNVSMEDLRATTGSTTLARPFAESWYQRAMGEWAMIDRAPDCNATEITGRQCDRFGPTFVGSTEANAPVFLASSTFAFDQGSPDAPVLTIPVPEGAWDLLVNVSFERKAPTSPAEPPALIVRDDAGNDATRVDPTEPRHELRFPAARGIWTIHSDGAGPWVARVEAVASPAAPVTPMQGEAGETPPTLAAWGWALATILAVALGILLVVLLRRRARPRYQLVRELASGAFGRTWLAQDTRLKRKVVIKELHAAAKADQRTRAILLREAEVVAKIAHPHVVTIYDVDIDAPAPRIIMEYVEGGNLAERIARDPLTLFQVERLASELLAALERVHAEGIIHRDIKPANVLLSKDGHAKLADFGTARVPDSAETLAATGGITGTPLYMSPEQVRGEKADARSDLYALAALIHEAATGHRVVGQPASLAGLQRAILEEPPRLAVDEPLRGVLAKALAKDPAARYQSAAEMRAAIARVATAAATA